jgi:hypothetical protein
MTCYGQQNETQKILRPGGVKKSPRKRFFGRINKRFVK